MKLFHAPGSCSTGIHLLLEEIGAPYEVSVVSLRTGEQKTPEYLAINPKGKVPALVRDDGRLLTEFPAIAFWLARSNPEAGLIPEDVDGQARALELTDYIVASIHMRGTTLAMRPANLASSEAGMAEVAEAGRAAVTKGYARLAEELGDQDYLMGDRFMIPDAAAYYVMSWSDAAKVPLPAALDAYQARIRGREAARLIET